MTLEITPVRVGHVVARWTGISQLIGPPLRRSSTCEFSLLHYHGLRTRFLMSCSCSASFITGYTDYYGRNDVDMVNLLLSYSSVLISSTHAAT